MSEDENKAPTDQFADVLQFNNGYQAVIGLESLPLRIALVQEESDEVFEAAGLDMHGQHNDELADLVELADGLADLTYVCLGALLQLFGEECAREIWAEVQRSNMAKFVDGRVVRREDGKVTKPEGWTPPDIEGVLRRHGKLNNGRYVPWA